MRKTFSAIVLVLLIVGAACAGRVQRQSPEEIDNRGLAPELASEIEAFIKETMAEKHSPGIAIGIVSGKELIYQGYFGYADIEKQKPVSKTTVFRIGSISKTFTTMGLMQQWEQGKFKLDDEFNSYMPYPVVRPKDETCPPVTFEHMLTHTSGGGELMSYRQIGHPFLTLSLPPGKERPPLEVVYQDGIRPGVCAGEKWCYCNFCFGALGFALEELSGMSFQEYTDTKVLAPIGMTSSSFYENDQIFANLAQGYHWDSLTRRFEESSYWNMPVTPMGNMYSTVPDMALYIEALLNRGKNQHGRLVEPETLEFMYQTHYSQDERQSAMGLCFVRGSSLLGTRVLGHGGAVPGFGSALWFAPDKKIGLIVFGNVMSSPPYEIAEGVLKRLWAGRPLRRFPLRPGRSGRGLRAITGPQTRRPCRTSGF